MPSLFYYYKDGEKCGPVDSAELRRYAAQGVITPETLLEDERGRKAKASSVAGLEFSQKEQTPNEQTTPPQFPQDHTQTNNTPLPPYTRPPAKQSRWETYFASVVSKNNTVELLTVSKRLSMWSDVLHILALLALILPICGTFLLLLGPLREESADSVGIIIEFVIHFVVTVISASAAFACLEIIAAILKFFSATARHYANSSENACKW